MPGPGQERPAGEGRRRQASASHREDVGTPRAGEAVPKFSPVEGRKEERTGVRGRGEGTKRVPPREGVGRQARAPGRSHGWHRGAPGAARVPTEAADEGAAGSPRSGAPGAARLGAARGPPRQDEGLPGQPAATTAGPKHTPRQLTLQPLALIFFNK